MFAIIDAVSITLLWWVRIGIIAAYVIATVGVIFGVYWENEDFSESIRRRGWKLLLWSLGTETLLTILLFATDSEIARRQNDEIISLQTRLLPRSLTPAARDRIAARVCPLGPQPSNLLLVVWGDQVFAGQIEGITRRCNWIPTGIPNREETLDVVSAWLGVVLLYDGTQPGQTAASKEFSAALAAEGIAAEAKAIPSGAKLAPIIHVVISAKP